MSAAADALNAIAGRKRAEVEQLRCAEAALWAKAESLPAARGLADALRGGTIIAEMKRRSPSAGVLRPELDPVALGQEYAACGAAAISVLTDGPDFGGSLDDLAEIRAAVDIPLLRKDFTIDPVQIAEARVGGADWVLLIVALLDTDALDHCLVGVVRSKAQAIVEVHDAAEARAAVAAGATCIGINNRNLSTLTTDLATFARVRQTIPDGVICIAESGVRSPGDVARLVNEGADAVLVGEALMRAISPQAACAAMVAAAHEAART
ncbi:MAG TPA: indole-3-glycerol phosphate synthase TrpC [Candidatus Dormibacteraeota bacterium]